MLHVWYIYPHDWVIYGVNVGKYSVYITPGMIQVTDDHELVLKQPWLGGGLEHECYDFPFSWE